MQPTVCDVRADTLELSARVTAGAARATGACTACAAHLAADAHYIEHAFGTAQRLERTAESIADCIGYCAEHAADLGRRDGFAAPIAQALHGAVERWHRWLGNETVFGDRVKELFFHAERACPACKFAERSATSNTTDLERALRAQPDDEIYARLGHLCFPHFRLLYVGADVPMRELALAHYRAAFDRTLAAHTPHEDGAADPDVGDLLHLVAGELRRRGDGAAAPAPCSARISDLPRLLADADTCPVCALEAGARARWRQAMHLTLQTGQPAWLSFPSCAEHVRAALAVGDDAIAQATALHAAEVTLSCLQRRLPPFTPPAGNDLDALRVRRVRRRRRGAAGGPPRPRRSVCVACERTAVARDAGIGALLDLLRGTELRMSYAHGYGLCLRHFARAYLFADKRGVRPLLVEVELERLAQVDRELARRPDRSALARALARFNGAVVAENHWT